MRSAGAETSGRSSLASFNARAEDELIRIAEQETDRQLRDEVLSRLRLLGTPQAPRSICRRRSGSQVTSESTYESRNSGPRLRPQEPASLVSSSAPDVAPHSQAGFSDMPPSCRFVRVIAAAAARARAARQQRGRDHRWRRCPRCLASSRCSRPSAAARRTLDQRGDARRPRAGRARRCACWSCLACDGWYRGRARADGVPRLGRQEEVRAMSATCTHLGCQVQLGRGRARSSGAPATAACYDAQGKVLEGPPPRPLDTLDARIDPGRRRGAGARVISGCSTGCTSGPAIGPLRGGPARRAAAAGHRLVLHARQRAARADRRAAPDRRFPDALLRAHTGSRATTASASSAARAAGRLVRGLHHFGASFLVVAAALHMLRVIALRFVQAAARGDLALRSCALRADPRVRADRISAAVGSARVLGHGRHDQHLDGSRPARANWSRASCRAARDRRADADTLVRRARHFPSGRSSSLSWSPTSC